MEATTHVHHPPLALSRYGTPSNPFLRFTPSPSILLRSRASATPPLSPIGARGNDNDKDDSIPYPESRNSSLGLSPLRIAVAAATTPQAALALSGGSCGGCDDNSTSSSWSSSSSCDDYSSDYMVWSPTWSSSKPKKEQGAEATHVSVGTAADPPLGWSSDPWFWGTVALGSAGAVALLVALQKRLSQTTSVVKLQVALRDKEMVKSVQKDLNAIAERVGASNRWWYKFILTVETLELNLDGPLETRSLEVVTTDRRGSWKDHFDIISFVERIKFDEETLSNSNGFKQRKTYSMKTDGNKNEYIVVTILVAASGTINLPETIISLEDLEAVAARLNSTPASELRGVGVMWTPQDADDVLSEDRIQKNYPYLKPLA